MTRRSSHQGKPLLSNHQKSWLWGTVPVWETLQTGNWPIYELLLSTTAEMAIHAECAQLARQQGIEVRREPPARLEQLCKARDHQGVLALMGPYPYADWDELLQNWEIRSSQQHQAAVIVVLDRLQDPFNVGAIIRSAAAFGVAGVVLGQQNQTAISSHVARSSAGAVNHVPIYQVEDLAQSLRELQAAGFVGLAAAMQGTLAIDQVRSRPTYRQADLALVIGNEATGVAPEIQQLCAETVSIPMAGAVESLNAAVAAGILLFSLCRPVG